MFTDSDDIRWGKLALTAFIVLCVLVAVGFLADQWVAAYNNNVTQPLRHSTITHNADWVINETAQFHTLEGDFEAARQRIPLDAANLQTFVASAGKVSTWGVITQQQYQQFQLAYTGDYQAEVSAANDYNALHDNPDDTLVPWPSDLPTRLVADAAPPPILPQQ